MKIYPLITLLILVVLSVTVYRAVYRKKINQQLAEKKSTAHVSMPSIASAVKVIVVGFMLYMMCSNMIQLQDIAMMQEENTNLLNNEINNLTNKVNELESELELQNADYILEDYGVEFGTIDYEKNTVKATVEIVMSKCPENTTLTGVVEMEKRNIHLEFTRDADGVFRAVIEDYPLFEVSDDAIVSLSISSGGNEYFEELQVSELCFPIRAYMTKQFGHTIEIGNKDGKLVAEGEFFADEPDAFMSQKLVVYDNGKEVKTIPLNGNGAYVSETFEENAQIEIAYRYQHKDAEGYIFEMTVVGTDEAYVTKVFDKDMKLLFG